MSKPTEARRAELKKWAYKFFSEVWDRKFTPPSDVQSGLIKYLVRDNVSDEMLKNIWDSTKAWVRYYRDAAGRGDFVKLPCASVWYNDHRYDNPIPSAMEAKAKADLKICSVEGCELEVHGSKFSKCALHINDSNPLLKDAWRQTGLSFSSPTFKDDCMAYCKSMGFRIGG